MKLSMSIAAVLFACGLAAADDTTKADKKQALEGTWTVVCAEKNGEPVADAKGMQCEVKGGVLTCTCPKTGMSVRLECTGPGKAKVSISDSKDAQAETKEAVYVLTNDYLAVCVHDTKNETGGGTTFAPSSKSACSVILTRGAKSTGEKKEKDGKDKEERK